MMNMMLMVNMMVMMNVMLVILLQHSDEEGKVEFFFAGKWWVRFVNKGTISFNAQKESWKKHMICGAKESIQKKR